MQAQAASPPLNSVRKLWKTWIFPAKQPPTLLGNLRLPRFGIGFHFLLASSPPFALSSPTLALESQNRICKKCNRGDVCCL